MTVKDKTKSIKIPVALTLILLFQVFKGIIWILIIPPWQSPDEPVHFAYVQYLGEENKLPVVEGSTSGGVSSEQIRYMDVLNSNSLSFHPEIKQNLNTPELEKLRHYVPEKSDRVPSGSTLASGYPPGYYALAALVYKVFYNFSIVVRLYAIKILSLILSIIAVWFSYLIGRKMMPESPTFAVALALMTGMQPMFSMVSTEVSNDIMLDTLSIVILFWLFNTLTNRKKLSNLNMLAGGMLMGIGLLTKAHMVFVTSFVLLTLLIALLLQKRDVRIIAKSLGLVIASTAIVYSGWAIFSWHHYRSLLGIMPFQPIGSFNGNLSEYLKLNFMSDFGFSRQYYLWVKTFWACFGWLDTSFPAKIYTFILIFMLLGILGTVFGICKAAKHKETAHLKIVIFSLLFYLCNIAFLYGVEFIYITRIHNWMLQGRYLLTALVPFNLLILFGYRSFVPKKFASVVDQTVIAGFVALNVASVVLLLHRYYGII